MRAILYNIVYSLAVSRCCHWLVVITTAQLHLTKSGLRFRAGPNHICSMPEVCDGENLWQWFLLKIRHKNFHWSNIPPKQIIIVHLPSAGVIFKTYICWHLLFVKTLSLIRGFYLSMYCMRSNFKNLWGNSFENGAHFKEIIL